MAFPPVDPKSPIDTSTRQHSSCQVLNFVVRTRTRRLLACYVAEHVYTDAR